jgi:hypothetical protein
MDALTEILEVPPACSVLLTDMVKQSRASPPPLGDTMSIVISSGGDGPTFIATPPSLGRQLDVEPLISILGVIDACDEGDGVFSTSRIYSMEATRQAILRRNAAHNSPYASKVQLQRRWPDIRFCQHLLTSR